MTVFCETLTRNLWISHFWGYQKLKLTVVFIEPWSIRLRRRPSASTSIETPGFNETTLSFNFRTPKNVKPQISCQSFTETVIKKKGGFLLKPNFSFTTQSSKSEKNQLDPNGITIALPFGNQPLPAVKTWFTIEKLQIEIVE